MYQKNSFCQELFYGGRKRQQREEFTTFKTNTLYTEYHVGARHAVRPYRRDISI